MRKKLLVAATSRISFRSNLKPLSFEVSDSVGPSHVQWRGWSYAAASVPSDTPNDHKGRKRIPKHERRAMVESYVNKYRTTNAGKFPTASDVKKHVGGCYYVVRQIIQELEYKSKMISSNSMDENLLQKEHLDESKHTITVVAKVSSGNTGNTKDRPIQDDSQSVVSDDRETIINAGYKHAEEKRASQMSSGERRLSKDIEIISTPIVKASDEGTAYLHSLHLQANINGNHCIASESNHLEKCSDKPYPSSIQIQNDIKPEEAVSSYSDSVAPASHLPQEKKRRVPSPFSDNYGTVYGKAPGYEYEFVDIANHQISEEKCCGKAGDERREQAASEDLHEELSHSSLQVPNNVKSEKDMSSYSSDSVAPERHPLKEEIEHVSASFIEKSGSSHSKAQSHDSKFVDTENHQVVEEKSFKKAEYQRKEQDALEDLPGMDGPNHKMEQPQGSLELDESKISSNNRYTSGAVVSEKATLWGNLKSFANGIINIWRKL